MSINIVCQITNCSDTTNNCEKQQHHHPILRCFPEGQRVTCGCTEVLIQSLKEIK